MISFNGVTKSFAARGRTEVRALSDVSFEVDEGEFISLLGPSGCGKSTLLKLVSGLMPPTSGTISINGDVITEPFPDIGFVFQQAVLLPWRNVMDNVLFSAEMRGLDVQKLRATAAHLLEISGLEPFRSNLPRQLSGGMQQRVSICRALVHDPKLLLMDEPFGALDAMTRDEMSFILLRIWEESRKTILFVTHSISEAVLLSDRVVVMSARPGRVHSIVRIDLPRPRTPEIENSDTFKSYVSLLKGAIFGGKLHG